MSKILKKVGGLFRSRQTDQPAMMEMTDMAPMTEIAPQMHQSDEMAANPGEMTPMAEMAPQMHQSDEMTASPGEMAQMQSEEGQTDIDHDMQPAAAMTGSMMGEQMSAATAGSTMEQSMPSAAGPVLVAQGQFRDGETYNKGSGRALIYKFSEGEYFLRFEDFTFTNGLALHVLLSSNPAATKYDDLGTTIDLGTLKGNERNQNYEIPAGTDLSQVESVVIFSNIVHTVISKATLEPIHTNNIHLAI